MKVYLFIYVGQLLHQRDSVVVDIGSRIDDTVDIDSLNINDTIDDSMRTSPIGGESTLLTDAVYDLYFIVS
jgi:hypothetical protein